MDIVKKLSVLRYNLGKFVRQPLRWLWYSWRILTGRGMKTIIYMKSGNKVVVDLQNYNFKDGRFTWSDAPYRWHELMHIKIDEVEAIVICR